jgi:hypothetical protein
MLVLSLKYIWVHVCAGFCEHIWLYYILEINVNVILRDERIAATETNLFPVHEDAISNIAWAAGHFRHCAVRLWEHEYCTSKDAISFSSKIIIYALFTTITLHDSTNIWNVFDEALVEDRIVGQSSGLRAMIMHFLRITIGKAISDQ